MEPMATHRLYSGSYLTDHYRRDLDCCRRLPGRPQGRTSFVAGAVLGGCAGLPFVSSTDAPAGRPDANVSFSRLDRDGVLHLHNTASLLASRGVQPSRHQQHGSADSSFKRMRNVSKKKTRDDDYFDAD